MLYPEVRVPAEKVLVPNSTVVNNTNRLMKWESQEESENTSITNKIVRQEDSEITRLNLSEISDIRNPGNRRVSALERK